MPFLILLILAVLAFVHVEGDIYFHNPRGSNNRLNEKTDNRQNANRVFDSQNNNKGGYNIGDKQSIPSARREDNQYQMKYFQSGRVEKTKLTLEWTNQHGCGNNNNGDQRNYCNHIIQYMCQPQGRGSNNPNDEILGEQKRRRGRVLSAPCKFPFRYKGKMYNGCIPAGAVGGSWCATTSNYDVDKKRGYCKSHSLKDRIRDGVLTSTQLYKTPRSRRFNGENYAAALGRKKSSSNRRAIHEGYEWYDKCYMRARNNGLFAADQKLKTNKYKYSSAIHTRQNPGGTRRGLECPEERDYYPYWHPTPWKDIAILADDKSRCSDLVRKSFNTKPYHECIESFIGSARKKHYSKWNNRVQCTANGGRWTELHNFLEKAPGFTTQAACEGATNPSNKYIWGIPYDTKDGNSKECLVALEEPACKQSPWTRSNHLGNGQGGSASNFTWNLPYFPSETPMTCVLRIRYNISTGDFSKSTDSKSNGKKRSPVTQDPKVYLSSQGKRLHLQLALNTNQYGRTFQDRSHTFVLQPRPNALKFSTIYNLNVRGKRGNIVQAYPAVEYDFVPNNLKMTQYDMVHIQWTGSNTNNAGAEGEGKAGTDRSNLVSIDNLMKNYPNNKTSMLTNAQVMWIYHNVDSISAADLTMNLASSGFYRCVNQGKCQTYALDNKRRKMQDQLNNAPASFEGVVLRFKKGTYNYMCTRNNNFTNRNQKGTITVN